MKSNYDLRKEAREALKGKWSKAVLLTLIYLIIVGLASGYGMYNSLAMQDYIKDSAHTLTGMAGALQDPNFQAISHRANASSGLGSLVQIFILLPLLLGISNAFLKLLVAGDDKLVENAFHIGFKDGYWHKLGGMLWMGILTFFWTLLLIVPGIIKAFSYSMTPYILAENPDLDIQGAIHRSRCMMAHHKLDLFILYLTFIGWFFLCLLTCGIGFLWLSPYVRTAQAGFYEEVKAEYALNGGLA